MTVTRNDTQVVITGGALDTIARCQSRLDEIGYWHGPVEKGRAAATFAQCLASVVLNAEWIGYDDDLALICRYRGGLVVGMIFHREPVRTTVLRYHDETALEHLGSTLDEMVESGTWSLNS